MKPLSLDRRLHGTGNDTFEEETRGARQDGDVEMVVEGSDLDQLGRGQSLDDGSDSLVVATRLRVGDD